MDFGMPLPSMYRLSSLLPYKLEAKKGIELAAVLKEYSLLLKAALETHHALVGRKLYLFDPLVGDNFCQARALRVALSFERCTIGFKRKLSRIETALSQIEGIFKSHPTKWFKTCNLTFQDFLQRDLELTLTADEFSMLLSYLLTVIKKEAIPTAALPWVDKTEPGRLNSLVKVSTNFAQNLIKILREKLADTSVQFVRKLSHLHMSQKNSLMLSDEYTCLHSRRIKCLHFYYGTKTIFESALQLGVPVVLWSRQLSSSDEKVIRDVCVFYRATPSGYVVKKTKLKDFGKGVIVVQGVARLPSFPRKDEWRGLLHGHNPSKLLAACSAEHRPYPDDNMKACTDAECERFKLKAKKWGCTIENPSLFFITHVFCQTLENIAPMKYELNSHLQKHFNFYIENGIQELKKLGGTSRCDVEGNVLTFHMRCISEKVLLQRRIQKTHFFMVNLKIIDEFRDCTFQIKLTVDINQRGAYLDNIVAVAKSHAQPCQFLVDHWAYWRFSSEAALEYLIADPKNFEYGELLELLMEILKEGKHHFKTQKQALVGLGKALLVPSIKEKVKAFLMEFVELTDTVFHSHYHYKDFDKLKVLALRQLSQMLDDGDVHYFFRKVNVTHPVLSVQAEARSHLDRSINALGAFNLELIQNLFAKRASIGPKSRNIYTDEILWHYHPYSCQYLSHEYGEELLYDEIACQYTCDTALYDGHNGEKSVSDSILRFIAMHTESQELFSKIIDFFMQAVKDQDNHMRFLSSLQSNQKVSIPKHFAHLIQPIHQGTLSLHGPIAYPRAAINTFMRRYLASVLYKMIGARHLGANVRLLAIRHCLSFFVFERDSKWSKSIEDARQVDDQKIAKAMRAPLKRLQRDSTENVHLRLAALSLLNHFNEAA